MNAGSVIARRASVRRATVRWMTAVIDGFERIPHSFIALLARFSIAATFWQSGQTKVENFTVDLIGGRVELGVPHLSSSAVDLFRDEYALPLIPRNGPHCWRRWPNTCCR